MALSLIFVPFEFLKLDLIYLFIIAGILAPGGARLLSYKGLEILGMSITTPIINAESLFSVAMALFFLNEPINFSIAMGILSVVSGLALLGYEIGQEDKGDISKRFCYRYLLYPTIAPLFYGVSVFFRKLGLNTLSSPILGATHTSGTSWCILSIVLATSGNMKKLAHVKKAKVYLFLFGWMCNLHRMAFFLSRSQYRQSSHCNSHCHKLFSLHPIFKLSVSARYGANGLKNYFRYDSDRWRSYIIVSCKIIAFIFGRLDKKVIFSINKYGNGVI